MEERLIDIHTYRINGNTGIGIAMLLLSQISMESVVLNVCSTHQMVLAYVSTQHRSRVSNLCRLLGFPRAVRASLCTVRSELNERCVSQMNRVSKGSRVLQE